VISLILISIVVIGLDVVTSMHLVWIRPTFGDSGSAAPTTTIEDWSHHRVGTHGVPDGWQGESWGKTSSFDLTIESDGNRRVLHLRSRSDRSTINRDLRGVVDLKKTPILEWSWKVVTLPPGGDARRRQTTDQAAQIYVVWARPPEILRSRIIGYAWDTTAPAGEIIKSKKTGTVTYVIMRSGGDKLGTWLTERRNVADDFRKIYGEEPGNPTALSISIDSNDTRSEAESYIGAIAFRAP
jgi:hypothetical protein